MKARARLRSLVVAGVVLVILVLAACGGQSSDMGGGETMDGEALLQDRCTQCHGLDRITSASKTQEEWQANVERMVQKGAELNDQEIEVLVAYLAETYGP
jgi:mono/diheme cytochrome c family protein